MSSTLYRTLLYSIFFPSLYQRHERLSSGWHCEGKCGECAMEKCVVIAGNYSSCIFRAVWHLWYRNYKYYTCQSKWRTIAFFRRPYNTYAWIYQQYKLAIKHLWYDMLCEARNEDNVNDFGWYISASKSSYCARSFCTDCVDVIDEKNKKINNSK